MDRAGGGMIVARILGVVLAAAVSAAIPFSQSAAQSADKERPTEIGAVCIDSYHRWGSIVIDAPGQKKLEFGIYRGWWACGDGKLTEPTWSISTPLLRDGDSGPVDSVVEEHCPALRVQMDRLLAMKRKAQTPRPSPKGFAVAGRLRAGRDDFGPQFQLVDANPSGPIAKWIAQTRRAIRPCWNNFRQDKTLYAPIH